MNDADEKPTRLLLHACCGPCSLEPVRLLRERGIEPFIFYANSNIHPPEEYELRLSTISTWADEEGIALCEGKYNPDAWERNVGRIGDKAYDRFGTIAGVVEDTTGGDDITHDAAPTCTNESNITDEATPTHSLAAEQARKARCRACYRMRLVEAARFAAENGFNMLGTTLTVSPYQYTDIIHDELELACNEAGIQALFEDYRPYYPEATRRSRAQGMYRQNFCGCRFSQKEAAIERAARKSKRDATRAAEREEHAAERTAAEAALADKRAKRAAYQAKQEHKHKILKGLRETSRNERTRSA